MVHFIKYSRYVNGLSIQAFGMPNLIPYELYEKRYYYFEILGLCGIFPFFGYISIFNFVKSFYGNYIKSIERYNCIFGNN